MAINKSIITTKVQVLNIVSLSLIIKEYYDVIKATTI